MTGVVIEAAVMFAVLAVFAMLVMTAVVVITGLPCLRLLRGPLAQSGAAQAAVGQFHGCRRAALVHRRAKTPG